MKHNKGTLRYSSHNPKLLRPTDLNKSGAELGTKVAKSNPPSITATETQQGNLRTNTNAIHKNPPTPPDLEQNYPYGFWKPKAWSTSDCSNAKTDAGGGRAHTTVLKNRQTRPLASPQGGAVNSTGVQTPPNRQRVVRRTTVARRTTTTVATSKGFGMKRVVHVAGLFV